MKKQPQAPVEHKRPNRPARREEKLVTAADSVNPVKWARDLFALHGPVDALRIASNYAVATFGEAPEVRVNQFKKFYDTAVAEVKRLKTAFEAQNAH